MEYYKNFILLIMFMISVKKNLIDNYDYEIEIDYDYIYSYYD